MKVLLLSAYDAVSHQYWRKGLTATFSQWQWTELCLPARHFSWRVRGNSLSWGVGHREVLERGYDLVVTTSMTDLATLRGLVPALATIPTLVYFHENQFAYPVSPRQRHSSVELQMLNLYTALVADRVLFNSHYNRHTFLSGVAGLLRRLPDHVPGNVVALLEEKTAVLPVPLQPFIHPSHSDVPVRSKEENTKKSEPFTLLWNHRWEYDKAPDRCMLILQELCRRDLSFRVHLLGQQFREKPVELSTLVNTLGDRLGHCGYIASREEYQTVLAGCDAVLSTALHDFQGLSVLEAVLAGAIPIVPDRLAYVELFAPQYRYPSSEDNAEKEAQAAADHIEQRIKAHEKAELLPAPSLDNLCWEPMRSRYHDEFLALMR